MRSTARRILVVGGGIGGTAAAAALAQRGFDVVLIEKRHQFTVPGVGLGQPANALRVFDALGVLPAVLAAGFQYDRMRYFDNDLRPVAEHRFLLGGTGIPAVCALSRSDLHAILLDAALAAGIEVRLGTTVVAMEHEPGGVHVTFADARQESFDLVVGFDGIRSTTRRFAFGNAFEPVESGFGAWRIQVPRPPEVDAMAFYQGVRGKTGVMPLRDDLMYLFHISPEKRGLRLTRSQRLDAFRERLDGYGGYISALRDTLRDSSDIVYSPLEPSLLPPPWNSGRIVLAGDAAHTFPPHLTQGAAMALEDGLVLADALAASEDIDKALASYTSRRYARCAFVYTFSMQMLHVEQMVHTPADLARARVELAANASTRLAAADRVLNASITWGG